MIGEIGLVLTLVKQPVGGYSYVAEFQAGQEVKVIK